MNTNSGRPMGVMSTDPGDKRAPAKTVVHFAKMEMFAVEMGDESGKKVTTTFFRMNGAWYHDPNAPMWAQKLREMDKNNWLYKQLEGAYTAKEAAETGDVPTGDTVSIMGRK